MTKKAIEYYTLRGLVQPNTLPNGYRDFSAPDMERLRKISVLRCLGLGTEVLETILADETGEALRAAAVQKTLCLGRDAAKQEALSRLGSGASYAAVGETLRALEQSETVTEKLLRAFPGYYGQFVCLHFARFLQQPIETQPQRAAYEAVLDFLDSTPPLELPDNLREYLEEGTRHITTAQISGMLGSQKASIEHPEEFLEDNKEILKEYLAYKQSEAYRESPAAKLMALLRQFNSASGYNDVFLPAMRQLSPAYDAYVRQMEQANEALLRQYPEIVALEQA